MLAVPAKKRDKELAPVHPNAGLEAAYRAKLDALIAEMQDSLVYWLVAAYRSDPPTLASDASAAVRMREAMRKLSRRWQKRFDDLADELARYFATAAVHRVDSSLKASLRKAGFSVKFSLTGGALEVAKATVNENVTLIKSIASQHLDEVNGLVMRSVSEGRNLGDLTKGLQERYGVTRRRAALIARDQNNKATSALARARQIELGITTARWRHSGGGKHPRPEHVAFSQGRLGGPFYDVNKGAFLEGVWTVPGREINCRCVSIPVIPGLSR